jgi:hypothetical protein
MVEMDRRLKEAKDEAARDLDAVLQQQAAGAGQNTAGEPVEQFGHSTPGPSSGSRRGVVFATTPVTPVVRVNVEDVDDDDDDEAEDDEEREESLQEQAAAAATPVVPGTATAATKHNKLPPPLSFWTGRAPEPPAMGQIGGKISNFIGKRPLSSARS